MNIRIPQIPTGIDATLTRILQAMKDVIDAWQGLKTDAPNDKLLAKSDVKVSWQNATLLDSWARYAETHEAAAYSKDVSGTVVMKGTVASGTVGATARVFVLPPGYRPAYLMVFPVITNTGIGQVNIEPTGEVRPISGGNTWFSLGGIVFHADA